MKNLPVPVSDEDIDEMFEFADKNKDGKLSYQEFAVSNTTHNIVTEQYQVMVKPQTPPEVTKPHITDIGMKPQVFSPPTPQEAPSNFASPLLPTSRGTYSSRSSLASFSTQDKKKTPTNSTNVKIGSARSSVTGSDPQIAHV